MAFRRALKEVERYLTSVEHLEGGNNEPAEESNLLRKWRQNPPRSKEQLVPWVAIHQQHLFVKPELQGAFLCGFPAFRRSQLKADLVLSRLFYECLRDSSVDI